jgi:hypothetical protein
MKAWLGAQGVAGAQGTQPYFPTTFLILPFTSCHLPFASSLVPDFMVLLLSEFGLTDGASAPVITVIRLQAGTAYVLFFPAATVWTIIS